VLWVWFFLKSDHDPTDPVVKKVAIYGTDFSPLFGHVSLHFPALIKQIFLLPKS
jgi:hypothetical protein